MKVKDLISKLEKLDPEMIVVREKRGITWKSFIPVSKVFKKFLYFSNTIIEETPIDDKQSNRKGFVVIE